MIKNNYLNITTFQKDTIKTLSKIIFFLFKKYKTQLFYNYMQIKKKKLTILRSPHVHKKARDQLEIKKIKHNFISKNYKLTDFFFYFFKSQRNKNSLKYQYKIIKNQKIIVLLKL
jgi:ribosomal protein S10